jgi:UDP-GlcNAc:undecaprenyl-phosphate GlcNAc-1-phosphate transferase
LGDSGSNLVGFLVAVIALDVVRLPDGAHALGASGLVLGVPILDAALTVVRRLRGEGGLFESERGHLHHRLMDGGLSHRGAVRRLWAATAIGIIAGACTLAGGLLLIPAAVLPGAMVLVLVLKSRARPSGVGP